MVMGKRWNDIPIERTDAEGYVYLRLPDHVLAMKNGTLGRHRYVLYEAMVADGFRNCGPTRIYFPDIPCAMCGWGLPWKTTNHRREAQVKEVLHADHINGVPGDDRPENLRPLCWWCNVHRGWGEAIAPEWYERMCRWFAPYPPNSRPEMHEMVADVLGYDPLELYKWERNQVEAAA